MANVDFNFQPTLGGHGLTMRPLVAGDFEPLHAAAADPKIWEGHPAKDRYKRDVFGLYFAALLDSQTTLAVIDDSSQSVIGCSRYYVAPDTTDDISIGFTFLNNAYWGGKTNLQMKRLMLNHAFETFDTVWFHIAPSNIRSQRATAKLGAAHAYDATLDLSGVPTMWMCFRLAKATWEQVDQAG